MEYAIFLDHNRHALLQYRDTGKTRHYIGIVDGTIECLQLTQKDFRGLKPYAIRTPGHFAETYLKSTLPISRTARSILRSILGFSEGSDGPTENRSAPRFQSLGVTIEQIAQENNWSASKCRKFLRKTMEKPGGRWVFSPEEAQNVVVMLKEFFDADPS